MKLYDVYIVNSLQSEDELGLAKAKLSARFKLTAEKAQVILDKKRLAIKKGVSEEQAQQLQKAIIDCGLEAELVPQVEEPELSLDLGLVEEKENEPDGGVAASETEAETDVDNSSNADVYSTPTASVDRQVYCRQCGSQMPQTQERCEKCGAVNSSGAGRSKVVAGLLAFFLGGFGLHRFYLGQWWGIFYIPFYFLFFLSSFVSLGEAIYFWACSNERWERKYGHLGKSSAWVIVAIAAIPVIAVLGIMAAVALPAYQDYTQRAQTSEAYAELRGWSNRVEEFVYETNFIPNSTLDIGTVPRITSQYLDKVEIVDNGVIVGTLQPLSETGSSYTITLVPEFTKQGETYVSAAWSCTGGTLPNRLRPAVCRGAQSATQGGGNRNQSSRSPSIARSANSGFQVTVPNGWSQGVTGEASASIDIGNARAEAYAILFEEEYDESYFQSLEEYAAAVEETVLMDIPNAESLATGTLTTHTGEEGRFLRMRGTVNEHDVIYIFVMFKQGNNYFRLVTWTLESRVNRNEAVLKQVAKSVVLP